MTNPVKNLLFELDLSVVLTWIDIFFMDELELRYSPVHGVYFDVLYSLESKTPVLLSKQG